MNKPKTISNEESDKLIHWLDNRYKTIFDLAVQSGLRISDILNLRVKDVSNPMTVYEKKSKRKRTFTITDKLYNQLIFLSDLKSKNDYVFESHSKTGVSVHRSTIHRHIKKAAQWSRMDCSTHSARKLYAQNILKETGSVEAVQKAMNHHKLSTTLTYLDIVPQDVTEAQEHATKHSKTSIFKRISNFIDKFIDKINHYKE